MNDDMAYLARAFTRMCAEAVQAARKEQQRVISEATRHGLTGRVLLLIKEEYERAALSTAEGMVRLTYDVTGRNDKPSYDVVARGLTELRDTLSNDFDSFCQSHTSWAPPNATKQVTGEFLAKMGTIISATLDDLNHGIAGGTRLTKDPLVSVISQITNSPGAVAQSGIGNVQHAVASGNTADIKSALTQFMNSSEVQGLSAENKVSVTDVAEVIASELNKPQPEADKIARWGKRLIDIAERLGIAIAASGLSHVLFG
jgi:hypothetical protein